jgi:GNAT superfamily N-acetyltransferase
MNDEIVVRQVGEDDISAMVSLSYQKRRAYEKAQPRFWGYAPGAEESQSQYFNELLTQDDHILLVAQAHDKVVGFVIGHLKRAPQVYDPGGLTLMIDDFCVETSSNWQDMGAKLLDKLKQLSRQQGASQVLVVCGAHDETKRQFLKDLGLTIASEWYVGEVE